MNRFVKSTGADPFLVDPNDFNPGFFGHLNALVDAITVLQNTGGGGPGGTPISVYDGVDPNPIVTNLTRLTFTGNMSVTPAGFGAADIYVPPFSVSDIPINGITFNYLPQIATNRLLGRYSTGTGDVEVITIGTGFSWVGSTLNATATSLTIQGTNNQIAVTPSGNTRTIALAALATNPAGTYNPANITVDAFGRITSASSTSITQVDLTSTTASTITRTPTSADDIVNKSYVDTFAQGLNPKASVRLATDVDIPTLAGTIFVDGIRATVGSRVLVKDQTDATENGIYVVGPGPSFTWTRATDADTVIKLISAYVFVQQGDTNADSGWLCTVDSGTIPTANIPWQQFTGAGSYSQGTGISISGNIIKLTDTLTAGGIIPSATGTFGSASNIPTFAVDAQGRITSVQNVVPSINLTSQVTSTLPVANGGTNFATYTAGDILYASSTSSLAKLAGGNTNNNKVLTIVGGIPSWENAPTGFTNPMGAAGDMIIGGTAGAATVLAGGTGNNNKVLKIVGGIPTWSVGGGAVGTVVSFVVDGYGGPLTGSATQVFVATIPFSATYNVFSVTGDAAPGVGNSVTLAVNGFSSVLTTTNTGAPSGGPITITGSGTLTFTLTVTGTSSATTRLFVNLSGTRS
jgi:hypothetical protein